MLRSVSTVRSYVLHSMSPLTSWDYLCCCFNRYSWSWAPFELTAGQCKGITGNTSGLFVLCTKLLLLSFRKVDICCWHASQSVRVFDGKGNYWRGKHWMRKIFWETSIRKVSRQVNQDLKGIYIGRWLSKRGPLASSIRITQELVKDANPLESETPEVGSAISVSTSLPGDVCSSVWTPAVGFMEHENRTDPRVLG